MIVTIIRKKNVFIQTCYIYSNDRHIVLLRLLILPVLYYISLSLETEKKARADLQVYSVSYWLVRYSFWIIPYFRLAVWLDAECGHQGWI